MKRYIITLILILVVSSIQATRNQRDSLRFFLEYVGEDSITISKIIKSPEAANPLEAIETYLISSSKFIRVSEEQITGDNRVNDSIFACKCAQYLAHLIINDTALHLVDQCLFMAFMFNHQKYNEQFLVECAEKSIAIYHAKQAVLIPELYYGEHKEVINSQEKKRFYEMVSFILSGPRYMRNFDKEANKKINAILAESNESSPCYVQFRKKLDDYSDMDLARITKEQEKELVSILLAGIANGEKKCQMTYSFMLLTGQFVEKDDKHGNELLFELVR